MKLNVCAEKVTSENESDSSDLDNISFHDGMAIE